MSDRVTVSIQDGIADVRLNRPDKINALDPAMFGAIIEAGEAVKNDSSVRAVVLSGEGRGFCAGLDFNLFMGMAGQSDRPLDDGTVNIGATNGGERHGGQQAAWVWTEVPAPVIAAIHGPCLGGGLQIALGADIRIVAPDAKLSVLEIRWGLSPDMTASVMLPRLVGLDRAKELMFTGRMVSGSEAAALGLATTVADDPRAAAMELAAEIASKNPYAVRGVKRLLEASVSGWSLAEQFKLERDTIFSLIGTPNQVEAVMAYFEKRDPNFTDPS